MKRLPGFIFLCIACLYPSIAMAADSVNDVGKLAAALGTIVISLAVLVFFSILFVYIPYLLIKHETNPQSNCRWLHHLLFAPTIAYLCFVILLMCIAAVKNPSTEINGILLICIIFISIIIYPCTYKLITYCLNNNTLKTIRVLQILSNIICILCCLAVLSLIPPTKYTLQDAFPLFTIGIIEIIPFAIALIIHNKLCKKMITMLSPPKDES